MNRRDFLLRASGAAGGTAAAAAAAPASAQETTSPGGTGTGSPSATTGNATGGNATGNATGNASANGTAGNATGNQTAGGGGGPTQPVAVGPGGDFVFEPAEVTVAPGTTVEWTWDSDNHNVVPSSQPEGAGWEGTSGAPDQTYDAGYSYSHTFTTTGTYEYYCQPHRGAGMVGSITVQSGGGGGGGGGEEEPSPEEMGVPIQAHWVGTATILMLVVTFIYTFFQLKYGESPNAKGGN